MIGFDTRGLDCGCKELLVTFLGFYSGIIKGLFSDAAWPIPYRPFPILTYLKNKINDTMEKKNEKGPSGPKEQY